MAYRVELNCADKIRFAEVSKELGLDGDELVKTLFRAFLDRRGVKNPSDGTNIPKDVFDAQRV